MINGLPTSLKQATDDVKPGVSLASPEMRARIDFRTTGSLSLSQVAGTVTSMPISFGAVDNYPGNAWQGWPQNYGSVSNVGVGTEVGDYTVSFYIGASRANVAEDGAGEVVLCGTAPSGQYRMKVQCRRDPGTPEGAPYSIAVVCYDSGWMRGNASMAYSDTYAGDYSYNEVINIPGGYPYVCFICYQIVNGFPGKPFADWGTPYYTTFKNARLGKA
jgi:hypothetical protein